MLSCQEGACENCKELKFCVSVIQSIGTEKGLHDKWRPFSTAPKNNTYIQLLVKSEYAATPHIVIARYDNFTNSWKDHANDGVFVKCETIAAWREWHIPELNFEDRFYYLTDWDIIQEGDEMQYGNDWITINDGNIKEWEKSLGQKLIYRKGGPKVRRKL